MTDNILQSGYDGLAAAWRALRRSAGLRLREVACVGAPRTLLLGEIGEARRPVISISAGVHGDEPAGVWALYTIVRDGLLDPAFAYRIWPCVNPTGYAAHTRENGEGIDINRTFGRGGRSPEAKAMLTANRDRRFVLGIDLHEDREAEAAYLYENAPSGSTSRYAAGVTAAWCEAGFALQHFDAAFDLGPPGSEVAQTRAPGSVFVDAGAERRFYPSGVPLALELTPDRAPYAVTFETPFVAPPAVRIAMHRVAVVTAVRTALEGLP